MALVFRRMRFLIVVFGMLASIGGELDFSGSNLARADYIGVWRSKDDTARTLLIGEDGIVVLTRTQHDQVTQKLKASSFDLLDGDLFVAKFGRNKYGASFKLVLSGWKLPAERLLYGLLLVYDSHGVQFNGIPVTFEFVGAEGGAA